MSDEKKKVATGVLVGLVDTGETGFEIGFNVGGKTVTVKPSIAASIADLVNILLEGIGYEEVREDEDDESEVVH